MTALRFRLKDASPQSRATTIFLWSLTHSLTIQRPAHFSRPSVE